MAQILRALESRRHANTRRRLQRAHAAHAAHQLAPKHVRVLPRLKRAKVHRAPAARARQPHQRAAVHQNIRPRRHKQIHRRLRRRHLAPEVLVVLRAARQQRDLAFLRARRRAGAHSAAAPLQRARARRRQAPAHRKHLPASFLHRAPHRLDRRPKAARRRRSVVHVHIPAVPARCPTRQAKHALDAIERFERLLRTAKQPIPAERNKRVVHVRHAQHTRRAFVVIIAAAVSGARVVKVDRVVKRHHRDARTAARAGNQLRGVGQNEPHRAHRRKRQPALHARERHVDQKHVRRRARFARAVVCACDDVIHRSAAELRARRGVHTRARHRVDRRHMLARRVVQHAADIALKLGAAVREPEARVCVRQAALTPQWPARRAGSKVDDRRRRFARLHGRERHDDCAERHAGFCLQRGRRRHAAHAHAHEARDCRPVVHSHVLRVRAGRRRRRRAVPCKHLPRRATPRLQRARTRHRSRF
mmetsp:Transcript_15776/g.34156  ORF Transcript_15776/g.34156 Transcript_15776/m.34156 type:complete len:476 (+) Transcript_15776:2982-4409(+)